MSVFTTLTLPEVQDCLQDFSIGEVTELKGIAEGNISLCADDI